MRQVGKLAGSQLIAFLFLISLATTSWAGAWGTGGFENDDALDWVSSCTGRSDAACISQALQAARSASYIEAPEAAAAVAAAEVIAAAIDQDRASLPAELRTWLAKQDQTKIRALAPVASSVLTRVGDARSSELAALWASDARSNWSMRIKDLARRLNVRLIPR
jgi:hypothetical protein